MDPKTYQTRELNGVYIDESNMLQHFNKATPEVHENDSEKEGLSLDQLWSWLSPQDANPQSGGGWTRG